MRPLVKEGCCVGTTKGCGLNLPPVDQSGPAGIWWAEGAETVSPPLWGCEELQWHRSPCCAWLSEQKARRGRGYTAVPQSKVHGIVTLKKPDGGDDTQRGETFTDPTAAGCLSNCSSERNKIWAFCVCEEWGHTVETGTNKNKVLWKESTRSFNFIVSCIRTK